MATTPVVPAAPVAAPAPAPSAPASAPAAATPTPTPTAPAAPTATPAAGVPSSGGAPASGVPASSGPQPPAKPDPNDFGNAIDHYEATVGWQQKMEEFKAENPDAVIPEDALAPAATDTPAEDAPAAETDATKTETDKPDEETQTGDEESFTLQDEPALTPQALNDIIKGDDALKTALESNPAAKGALFKMAREHAELSQFKGIFPTADSAKFARDTANRHVAISTLFEMADTPEGMAKAFDSFAQEFAVVGADGQPVKDASGNPVYGDDFYAFGEHIVDRYAASTMDEVTARLTANQYKNDAERVRDEDLKIAMEIIKGDLHPAEGSNDPDLSHLPDEARAEVQARLDEVKRREAELDAKTGKQSKQSREQVRKEGTDAFFKGAAERVWTQVDNIIDKLRKSGAVIPDWQLNTPLPGTNMSAFKNAVGNQIEQFIKADPYITNQMLQLELQYLANPTPENTNQRVAAFDSVLQQRDQTGKSLLNRIVSNLVHKYGSSVQASAEASNTPTPEAVSREPRPGGVVQPHAMTADEAWKAAESSLAKEVSGWDNMDSGERMSYVLGRQRQLLTTKR